MTHLQHPPSEMHRAIRDVLRKYDDPILEFAEPDRVRDLIRTVFAHVDRAAMVMDACKGDRVEHPCVCARDGRPITNGAPQCRRITAIVDAALAAALAAALPGDA